MKKKPLCNVCQEPIEEHTLSALFWCRSNRSQQVKAMLEGLTRDQQIALLRRELTSLPGDEAGHG